jgi:hypothetical protein
MDRGGTLRVLWQRRFLVSVGVVLSLAVGALATNRVSIAPPGIRSPQTTAWTAATRVFVDTPRSLATAARTKGDETIVARASLLAGLAATDQLKGEIARGAGLRPSQLGVHDPYVGRMASATPLSQQAIEVTTPTAGDVVTVNVDAPQVPVVSISTQAADRRGAVRLAEAARSAIESLVLRPNPNGSIGVSVERLGPVSVEPVAAGSGRAKALVAFVVTLVLWCGLVILFNSTARRRRTVEPRLPGFELRGG